MAFWSISTVNSIFWRMVGWRHRKGPQMIDIRHVFWSIDWSWKIDSEKWIDWNGLERIFQGPAPYIPSCASPRLWEKPPPSLLCHNRSLRQEMIDILSQTTSWDLSSDCYITSSRLSLPLNVPHLAAVREITLTWVPGPSCNIVGRLTTIVLAPSARPLSELECPKGPQQSTIYSGRLLVGDRSASQHVGLPYWLIHVF